MSEISKKSDLQNIAETVQQLNSVSKSFCLVKWTMATIHLQQGETHSCYHPMTHQVPLTELKSDPSSLHNTSFKKSQRKLMLEGARPSECQYCWNIEDLGKNLLSDRMIRSAEPWSKIDFQKIKSLSWEENINPRYLEISFDSVCQLKCIYCNPTVSTKWLEEVKQHGGYKTSCGFNDYMTPEKIRTLGPKENNPYTEAFWKWWPSLKKDLLVFRITGGEPLLSKETFKILDSLILEPKPDLDLFINSNLSVSSGVINLLIEKLKILKDQNCIKSVTIFGSVDTFGEQAEYIRTGLDFNRFINNVENILTQVPKSRVSFTVTYNALSIPRFIKLLGVIKELRGKYNVLGTPSRIIFDTPYLLYPKYLSIQILPTHFIQYIDAQIDYVAKNRGGLAGFSSLEHAKLIRLKLWMGKGMDAQDKNISLKDFYIYFNEHDRRRNTNFKNAFPELSEFFSSLQVQFDEPRVES